MFINSEHKINSQKGIIESLQAEIIGLIKERDLLIQENEGLLKSKTEIGNTTEQKKKELATIDLILTETKKVLEKQQNDFINLTDKQQLNIKEFNELIQKRLGELSRLEGIELIDFDTENRKIKAKLNALREEYSRMENDIRIMKEEQEDFERYKKQEESKIEIENEKNKSKKAELELKEQQLQEENRRLAMREQRVKIMEKQIADFKIS